MSNDENKLRIRPRFRRYVGMPVEQVIERIHETIKKNTELCSGKIVKNHIIIKIPAHLQHYWSPQLTLELEKEDSQTLIRGLFGPKPGVWTMFVFFYSAFGFLTMMGLIFGLSQLMLKMDAYGLWSVPVGLLIP